MGGVSHFIYRTFIHFMPTLGLQTVPSFGSFCEISQVSVPSHHLKPVWFNLTFGAGQIQHTSLNQI